MFFFVPKKHGWTHPKKNRVLSPKNPGKLEPGSTYLSYGTNHPFPSWKWLMSFSPLRIRLWGAWQSWVHPRGTMTENINKTVPQIQKKQNSHRLCHKPSPFFLEKYLFKKTSSLKIMIYKSQTMILQLKIHVFLQQVSNHFHLSGPKPSWRSAPSNLGEPLRHETKQPTLKRLRLSSKNKPTQPGLPQKNKNSQIEIS